MFDSVVLESFVRTIFSHPVVPGMTLLHNRIELICLLSAIDDVRIW